ncbi:MAG: hypothetical protein ABFD92_10760 [Planctomycetaceae bacterium]
MSEENVDAVTGSQPTMPAETIATESASVGGATDVPVEEAEPTSEAEAAPATQQEAEAAEPSDAGDAKPEKMDWRERRRIEETNKRKAAEAELEKARAELAKLRGTPAPDATQPTGAAKTEAEIRAEAVQQAKLELAMEAQQEAFHKATGRVLEAGRADYPDFDAKRAEMITYFGDHLAQRPDFFEAIVDLENGHDVFYALAKDPEQAEQILTMPPVKMALKLSQLSSSISKPSTSAPPKPISRAPAPITPVGGTPQYTDRLDDEAAPMDKWAGQFLKQMAGRGR